MPLARLRSPRACAARPRSRRRPGSSSGPPRACRRQAATCAPRSLSRVTAPPARRGQRRPRGSRVALEPTNATRSKPRSKREARRRSGVRSSGTRVAVRVAGSSAEEPGLRALAAPKKMPVGVQPRATGPRRTPAVRLVGAPPVARDDGDHAVREVEPLGAMADSKAICGRPATSAGCVSGPACVTSARTSRSATLTTEMSALPPSPGSEFVAVVEGDLACRPATSRSRRRRTRPR